MKDRKATMKRALLLVVACACATGGFACTGLYAGRKVSADAVVKYCREHIDPSRLKGFYTAPWARTLPDAPDRKNITKVIEGIDLLKGARDRHYGA